MAKAYRSIARIQKTHGRKGEVVVVPTDGLPLLLCEGMQVALVPPELKGPRWRVVRTCTGNGTGQLVSFVGVDSLGQASVLVGKSVLAREEDLPTSVGLRDAHALMGRGVVDVRLGPLGTVSEIMRGPAQDVLVVCGKRGEVLIPAVEPVVLQWAEGRPIEVDLPRGLVDEGLE